MGNNNIDRSANNKRIAKNTMLLYVRMLFLMGVSLYTSRVILNALGVEDYGIYGVVGGFVMMFSMISGSLSSAISRFITFELGKGDQKKLNTIFSTSVLIQLFISLIIVVLVESVGVWFLENKLVIPADRLIAARWVLQFSLLSMVLGLISVPYNAAIIAHERMGAFAFIGIIDAVFKLVIAYFLVVSPYDRLITYSALTCFVAFIMRVIYGVYSTRNFEESKFRFVFDFAIFKEMFTFAGWNFIGALSALLRDQGGNMILNIVGGGPVVNAARGISTQVNAAVGSFVSNFMTALNPQITKSYASGDREYMLTLVSQGARLSFYMLLTLSLPIIISTPYILELWLKTVPDYTVIFVRLSLVFAMCESISNPLITAMLATGNIKNYQIVVGGINLLNLPLSFLLLKLGFFPPIVSIVAIFISICALIARLYMLRGMIGLSARRYAKDVFFNVVIVAALSYVVPYFSRGVISENIWGAILVSFICLLSSSTMIYFVGCNHLERQFVNNRISKIIRR